MGSGPKNKETIKHEAFVVELLFVGDFGSEGDAGERLFAIYDFILNYEKKEYKQKK